MLKQISKSYCCIGLMSGTSLDGLDIVLCYLFDEGGKWGFEIVKTKTVVYSDKWKQDLSSAGELKGSDLLRLSRCYGKWIGEQVTEFMDGEDVVPDFIASHGHTVFHDPQNQFNYQLGDGAMIAAVSGITTVCDFRSLDVALGGEGAPLVPIGDYLLFDAFDACVNLGGFANVSGNIDGKRRSWDICPVNIVLNKLVGSFNLNYDDKGELGRQGRVVKELLDKLNGLAYYSQAWPKSLSHEWLINAFDPNINRFKAYGVPDLLRTCYEHFAVKIANDVNLIGCGEILFTGGGVYNSFLMQLIQSRLNGKLIVPEEDIIEYKEALIFALLGALRISNQTNCLSSVTGAVQDSCSGAIYYGCL